MSHNVVFNDEPQYTYRASADLPQKKGSIIGLMYKLGVAKTEKDANVVLSGIILVCFIVSATMFVFVQPHPDLARQAALQHDLDRMNTQLQAANATH